MKRTVLALAVLAATVCLASMLAATRKDVHAAPSLSRTFEFVYVVHVPALPPGSHEMRIWLPLPQTGAHQKMLLSASQVRSRIAFTPIKPMATAQLISALTRQRRAHPSPSFSSFVPAAMNTEWRFRRMNLHPPQVSFHRISRDILNLIVWCPLTA